MAEKRPALGRGLSALIPDAAPARAVPLTEIDIDRLAPNREQPRRDVDAANLDGLAQSIRANGIIQPLVVRQTERGYEIVAGERRWRAAQRAGLLRVPIVVRDVTNDQLLPLALIENLQREDLNPIEEAVAYQRLVEHHGLTHDTIATAVGKDRSTVANALRLLKLPEEIKAELAAGGLTVGHARALLAAGDEAAQRRAAREVLKRRLSVRETEAFIRKLSAPAPTAQAAAPDVHVRAAEERLRLALGTRVRIVRKRKGGRIEIDFGSEEELQRIYEQLSNQ
ncbi:MAG: ParB/RepB/Spo0J family partition protein [Vicinamibacterales bacterium]|jgi:ParB family chromosome partitioning protein|nr:ParB/RepB/Spo0J family partition protein [Vicinamibacterales bacterium]MDP6609222.1 ParB/RepB/Spo0J family partition protein [Vicinamibacterales bacterium]|tara:strand:- start:6728 stop:7573 length:846 start_codon:yes stop_codon:yes gene_type:complete